MSTKTPTATNDDLVVVAIGSVIFMALVGTVSWCVAKHYAPPRQWAFWRFAAPAIGIALPSLVSCFREIWNFDPVGAHFGLVGAEGSSGRLHGR